MAGNQSSRDVPNDGGRIISRESLLQIGDMNGVWTSAHEGSISHITTLNSLPDPSSSFPFSTSLSCEVCLEIIDRLANDDSTVSRNDCFGLFWHLPKCTTGCGKALSLKVDCKDNMDWLDELEEEFEDRYGHLADDTPPPSKEYIDAMWQKFLMLVEQGKPRKHSNRSSGSSRKRCRRRRSRSSTSGSSNCWRN